LCEFNTEITQKYSPVLCLCYQSLCYVTYWQNMWPWCHRSMYFT